jgi:hypothetical protein
MDILERVFQRNLIRRIKKDLPGCIVLKNDAQYIQGFPDLLILNGDRWAALEVKKDAKAKHQPNQDYYVRKLNAMSFARFIYPENERTVRHELYQSLRSGRDPRVSESEPERLDKLHGRETGPKIFVIPGRGKGNPAA